MPRPDLDELIARGAVAPGTADDIAHSSVGLAVRTGAPKPDIGSVAALRQALLQACSLAYSDGPSGAYIVGLLTKLGIAEEVAPKSKLTSRPVAELVASGEAEVGMQQIVAILPVNGAEISGTAAGRVAKCHYICRRDFGSRAAPCGRGVHCVHPDRSVETSYAYAGAGASVIPSNRRQWDMGSPGIGRNACAIALLCPYRLDLRR